MGDLRFPIVFFFNSQLDLPCSGCGYPDQVFYTSRDGYSLDPKWENASNVSSTNMRFASACALNGHFQCWRFLVSCVVAPVVGLTTSLSSVLSRSGEERVLRRTVGWFRASRRILISCLRGDRPPSCSTSFSMDATWGIPVASSTDPSLRDRAASNQGPGHITVLTGSSLHGAPQRSKQSNTARTATSVALGTTHTCQPGTSRIVRWRC